MAFTPDTFNPADCSTGLALDATGLIVSVTNSNNNKGVRTNNGLGQGAGQFYFEFTSDGQNQASASGQGMAQLAAGWDGVESEAYSAVIQYYGYGIYENGGQGKSAGLGPFLAVAVDLTKQLIWFNSNPTTPNWNGQGSSGDPVAGTGGVDVSPILSGGTLLYPCVLFNGSGDPVTANFGASAFQGAVPTGYTAGWPASTGASSGTAPSNANTEGLASQVIVEAIGQNSGLGAEVVASLVEVVGSAPGNAAAVSNIYMEAIWKPVVAIRVMHWNGYTIHGSQGVP